MRSSHSLTLAAAVLSTLSGAKGYVLTATYDASNFFDEFSFFQGADPTFGFVDYLVQDKADSSELIKYENNQVYLGVDTTTVNPTGGRGSVRLTSNEAFSMSPDLIIVYTMFLVYQN